MGTLVQNSVPMQRSGGLAEGASLLSPEMLAMSKLFHPKQQVAADWDESQLCSDIKI